MANADRLARGEIQDHMPVVGSDGQPFGTVDRVEGEFIKLARSDPTGGDAGHRWLPLSTVAGLDGGLVRLSMPARQAGEACLTEAEVAARLSLDADAGASFGRPADDHGPHGSRGQAHGGPKGKPQHGAGNRQPQGIGLPRDDAGRPER